MDVSQNHISGLYWTLSSQVCALSVSARCVSVALQTALSLLNVMDCSDARFSLLSVSQGVDIVLVIRSRLFVIYRVSLKTMIWTLDLIPRLGDKN